MYCHGHTCSQVSHLAVRPLSLTLPTMTYGRANGKCIAAVVEHSGAESHGSLNQVAQKFW